MVPVVRVSMPSVSARAYDPGFASGGLPVHVVVVGCGRVGSELATALELAGHSVAVVDKNARAFRRLSPDFSGRTVTGFGFDRDHLAQAGIEEAGAFASVTNGDNSNILCARIARETYGIERVVARIYDPRRALIYQRLGISTVATVSWTTDQVLRRLLPDETRHDWIDATGKVGLVEAPISAAAVGHKLGRLNQPGRFWLTAVSRFGQAQIVTGDMVGQEGDVLTFVSAMDAIDELHAHLAAGGEH
jgi:trk system potassium uptake protein TrkA